MSVYSAILFDMDGVLASVGQSYREAIILVSLSIYSRFPL